MTTFPLATLGVTITPQGISAPSFADILASLQAESQSIFGSDIYITPDSQDGQFLASQASAINDLNQKCIAVYMAYSPTYAQGQELASLVKINGLKKLIASNSTAAVALVGQFGTVITNGKGIDALKQIWNLPSTVTIPISGTVTVTAVADQLGAIAAPANTITGINTPTRGWQTINNPADAVPGAPIESDPTLRARQAVSTSLPSLTNKQGIYSALGNVAGVQRLMIYENDTDVTDANGIPRKSISVVILGGDVMAIAQTIDLKKAPGCGTYGTTVEPVTDSYGMPNTIKFFLLSEVTIGVQITIKALAGYVSTTATLIEQEVADFLNGLDIGGEVYQAWVSATASLIGDPANPNPLSRTFKIVSVLIFRDLNPPSPSDITIAFNEAAVCNPATDINITVT